MSTRKQTRCATSMLAACIAGLLVSGCGGGSGGGMVRSDQPPPPPAPPPPAPQSLGPCTTSTADCVVTSDDTMLGGRTSTQALTVRGANLDLGSDSATDPQLGNATYAFDGGTTIESGWLRVRSGNTLVSSVDNAGALDIAGTVEGDVANQGSLRLSGLITGNVTNGGNFQVVGAWDNTSILRRIEGNFGQAASGTLMVDLAPGNAGDEFGGWLDVAGRADLDGTVELHAYTDAFGPYPLPTAMAHHILHADGGVFGQFAQWTSPGLFIDGTLRYLGNDVWFDLSRISVQSAIAAQGASAQALAAASHLDAALLGADAFAMDGTVNATQRRFLASASALLYMRDTATATAALDSLSGHVHLQVHDALQLQASRVATRLDARLDGATYDAAPRAWTQVYADGGAGLSGTTQATGVEQWMGPRWLVGGGLTAAPSLRFDAIGGTAQGTSPTASVYAHYRGYNWQATALLGAGRANLDLRRPILLGAAGTHLAFSRRTLEQAFAHVEAGRGIAVRGGTLTPFVAFDFSDLRSAPFNERGDTGFELQAGAGHASRSAAAVGARFQHGWRFDGGGWLQLGLEGRREQRLSGTQTLTAAFSGVPDVAFALDQGLDGSAAGYRWGLRLAGGYGNGWTWSLDQARQYGASDLLFGMRRAF